MLLHIISSSKENLKEKPLYYINIIICGKGFHNCHFHYITKGSNQKIVSIGDDALDTMNYYRLVSHAFKHKTCNGNITLLITYFKFKRYSLSISCYVYVCQFDSDIALARHVYIYMYVPLFLLPPSWNQESKSIVILTNSNCDATSKVIFMFFTIGLWYTSSYFIASKIEFVKILLTSIPDLMTDLFHRENN